MKRFFLFFLFILLFKPVIYSQSITDNFLRTNQNFSSYKYSDYKNGFKPKSPTVAFLLSSGVTLGAVITGKQLIKNGDSKYGAIFLVGGILVGPSAGNMYARNQFSVYKGISTRLLGGLIGAGGAYLGIVAAFSSMAGDRDPFLESAAYTLLISGAGLVVYSTLYDFINAPRNVEKYNSQNSKFNFSPVYYPVHKSLGLSMNISF